MDKFLSGDTRQFTWISSGAAASPISAAILNSADAVVSSVSMTDSGAGHYYAVMTMPNTQGYYVKETLATVNSKQYKQREKFKIILCEVD